jgi:LmbE family N-acetylglucosaminyl deacetylase
MPALLVVSPHPDDEVLGAGALIGTAARSGIPVHVLAVTDGNSSHPPEIISPDRLGEIRAAESLAALTELSSLSTDPEYRIQRHGLQLPDGEVSTHEADLVEHIAEALAQLPAGTWVAAPLRMDGHPDHQAAGRAAHRALARFPTARLVEYTVWLWQHTTPGSHPDVPWTAARTISVDDQLYAARDRAMDAFRSQISTDYGVPNDRAGANPEDLVVIPRHVRERMMRRHQIVFPQANAGFSTIYQGTNDPWSVTERWYEKRKYAITMAMLPKPRFRRAYEPGCSVGVLTQQLAQRCDVLIATDIVPAALEAASARVSAPHVEFRLAGIDNWPAGQFDLIVISELAYYLSEEDFAATLHHAAASLDEDGVLIAADWRHEIAGAYRNAHMVHRALAQYPGWTRHASYEDDDVLIDVYGPPQPSIATTEFLSGG